MKNTRIKNLNGVVPADIRLEVYRETKEHFKNILRDRRPMEASGLCLALPVFLWGLKSVLNTAPDGYSWRWGDTQYAFPELTSYVIDLISIEAFNDGNPDLVRIKLLDQWIKELENQIASEHS